MMLKFCLNDISFTLDDQDCAFQLLYDAIVGMFTYSNKHKCRQNELSLYSYKSLNDVKVASDYTFKQFKDDFLRHNKDLAEWLLNLISYGPYEDFTKEDSSFYNFGNCYIPDIDIKSDTLPLAHSQNAILLSQNTHSVWSNNTVNFYDLVDDKEQEYSLDNISSKINGKSLFEREKTTRELLPDLQSVIYSSTFVSWYYLLSDELKKLTCEKIIRCHEINFRAAEPLMKKLEYDLWEIRYSNSEGAARILIYFHQDKKLLLTGFVKRGGFSKNYANEFKRARKVLESMVKA